MKKKAAEKLAKKSGSKEWGSKWSKVRPMRDLILVVDEPIQTKSEGGIHFPVDFHEGRWLHKTGLVAAVGHGRRNPKTGVAMQVGLKPGDRIYYLRTNGNLLETLGGDDQFIRMLDPSQISGIVEEEEGS